MSKSYIPQNTYVVCTYQLNPTPKKLIATRSEITVLHKGEPLLTAQDRNTNEPFTCKSPAKKRLFIAGFIVGLILASNPIGWAIIGVCTLVLAAGVAIAIAASHDCTNCLNSGKWINYKSNTKFNGYPAITRSSLLICSEGGCLQPIISYEIATKTASAISTNNTIETGISTIGAIFSGYLCGEDGGIISALKTAFSKSGILFTLGGVGATYAMTSFESHLLRKDKSLAGNDIYKRMNEGGRKDWAEKDTYIDEAKDVAIGNTPVPADIRDVNVVGTVNAYNTFKQTSGDLSKFQSIENLSRQQMRNDPIAQSLLKDLNKGKHPNIVNKSKYYNERRLNPTTRNEAISQLKDEVAKNKSSAFKKGMKIVLFFLPLVDTYFSEQARKVLAEEAIKDINNSISVVAEK